MAVVFEISKGFERVHPFYQELVQKYFIKQEFDSLDEALKQKHNDVSMSYYFKIRSAFIKPKNLPTIIDKAEIEMIVRDYRGIILHNQPESAFPVLTAKVVN